MAGAAVLAVGLAAAAPAVSAEDKASDSLNSPRGLAVGAGKMVVSQGNGVVKLVKKNKQGDRVYKKIGELPNTGLAPALAVAPDGAVWAATTTGEGPARAANPGSRVYRMAPGKGKTFKQVANIGKYQLSDPDEADIEDNPTESNPYGIAITPEGDALMADAAGNDLLKVTQKGQISTVARVLPRMIPAPPMGTDRRGETEMMPTEAVVTSVAVGSDGNYYIGELRGWPGTPEYSQIWKVKAGVKNAVCDPDNAENAKCSRYVDGLTSIVALDADDKGAIYAVELSKQGWFATETGEPGSEIGSVLRIAKNKNVTEYKAGEVVLPGGIAVTKNGVFVTTPMFGDGSVRKVG